MIAVFLRGALIVFLVSLNTRLLAALAYAAGAGTGTALGLWVGGM